MSKSCSRTRGVLLDRRTDGRDESDEQLPPASSPRGRYGCSPYGVSSSAPNREQGRLRQLPRYRRRVDNVEGIVLDHSVHLGIPPEAPLLAAAIARTQALFDRSAR